MNEAEFRNWLSKNGVTGKVQSDCVSRIKRIEKELDQCDIDEGYRIDKCEHLMSVFSNMGINNEMKKYSHANLPIGKYYMNTYRRAIRQYVEFMDSTKLSD